jgi:MoaA/NifB/PqqE/SkfB family radical SAM enzyme
LDQHGCFGLGFGGGEPTLFPKFGHLCRVLAANTSLAITMTTHGHRFNSKLVDELSGNIHFIRLSMDGVGSTYERLRGRSFTKLTQQMALVRATARFGVNYVINRDTIDDLPRAADFVFLSGAEELLLLPETSSSGEVTVDSETMAEVSDWARRNYSRCRLATSAHAVALFDAPVLQTAGSTSQGHDFMHVDAFSKLKTCAFANLGISLDPCGSILEAIRLLRATQDVQASTFGRTIQ